LRLGHRPTRDKRITTHVCLVARAFGASAVHIAGARDDSLQLSITKVTETWGGPFSVEFIPNPTRLVKEWKSKGGQVAHLTMYGARLRDALNYVEQERDQLIVVGGEKVPAFYYEAADINVAVGSQPHSEVAALALFLDRMTGGNWEDKAFTDAKLKIIHSERGKTVKQLPFKKKDI